jgi:hypothetical protein
MAASKSEAGGEGERAAANGVGEAGAGANAGAADGAAAAEKQMDAPQVGARLELFSRGEWHACVVADFNRDGRFMHQLRFEGSMVVPGSESHDEGGDTADIELLFERWRAAPLPRTQIQLYSDAVDAWYGALVLRSSTDDHDDAIVHHEVRDPLPWPSIPITLAVYPPHPGPLSPSPLRSLTPSSITR